MIPLSRRQREVMILKAQGLTFKEIAHQLGISMGTAKAHVTGAYSRLGVQSLPEALAVLGWLNIPQQEEAA